MSLSRTVETIRQVQQQHIFHTVEGKENLNRNNRSSGTVMDIYIIQLVFEFVQLTCLGRGTVPVCRCPVTVRSVNNMFRDAQKCVCCMLNKNRN